MNQEPNIPTVPIGRITKDVISKTDLMLKLIAVEKNIRAAEEQIARETGLSSGLLRMYKKELRKIFEVPERTSISHLVDHPQIRQALESILTRKERTDKLQLRSAKKLDVVMPTGEFLSVENFLKALYPNENANAISCYRALVARCKNKLVLGRWIGRRDDRSAGGRVGRAIFKTMEKRIYRRPPRAIPEERLGKTRAAVRDAGCHATCTW